MPKVKWEGKICTFLHAAFIEQPIQKLTCIHLSANIIFCVLWQKMCLQISNKIGGVKLFSKVLAHEQECFD